MTKLITLIYLLYFILKLMMSALSLVTSKLENLNQHTKTLSVKLTSDETIEFESPDYARKENSHCQLNLLSCDFYIFLTWLVNLLPALFPNLY